MTIETQQPAPDFTGATNDGPITLSDLRGHPVVLFFYPKDNTPGCTKEACGFRDVRGELEAKGAKVFGLSKDNLKSHARFTEKFGLNFPLISDPDLRIHEAYGAWGDKKMYGKTFLGVIRTTVLIDGDGVIQRIWSKVKVAGHVDAVLEAIDTLSS